MSILYWFRKNTRSLARPGTVYCRITVDGVEHNFATTVRIFKDEWNATTQEVRGRSDAAKVSNDILEQLKTDLREAHTILQREGTYITPARVLERAQKPQAKQLPLRELISRYAQALAKQHAADIITAGTLEAYEVRLARLDEWLGEGKRHEMRPVEFTLRRGQQFFDWLLQKPRSRNYCIKVIEAVQGMFKWALRQEYIDANPLLGYSEKPEAWKAPVFLTPPELVKLWYYEFASQSLRQVADVFLFQCFTGLAWQDLYNFRASEHLLPQATGQILLQLARQKTGSPVLIPFFSPAFELLARYGGEKMPVPSKPFMNRSLKQIAYLLDFKKHITTHVGRKTAGMMLLQDGVPMTIVSRWMGHKSVRVTERSYAFVLSETISNELSKVYGAQVVGIQQTSRPFLLEFTERLQAA